MTWNFKKLLLIHIYHIFYSHIIPISKYFMLRKQKLVDFSPKTVPKLVQGLVSTFIQEVSLYEINTVWLGLALGTNGNKYNRENHYTSVCECVCAFFGVVGML